MSIAQSYAAFAADKPLEPHQLERREPGPQDVEIDILYCGVCHSDMHCARGDWGPVPYPLVPGHEIIGRVARVGAGVKGFAAGALVGVGCMVDSCRHCPQCESGLEQYCDEGMTGTYAGVEKETGRPTAGGYSTRIVVNEGYVLRIPETLDPAAAAPLLCAGITTWSPLRHWKVGPGSRVGVVGLGGLGHMGVKFARALGAHVVLFTTSPDKVADGLRLGAHEVVLSRDEGQMKAQASKLDFILNTVAAPHDLDAYIGLLKLDGTMVLVGAPASPHPSPAVFPFLLKRRSLAGSAIGGIAETQEMLDFCAEHGIASDIELIPMQQIEPSWERMLKGQVKYRFVIDMASLKQG